MTKREELLIDILLQDYLEQCLDTPNPDSGWERFNDTKYDMAYDFIDSMETILKEKVSNEDDIVKYIEDWEG